MYPLNLEAQNVQIFHSVIKPIYELEKRALAYVESLDLPVNDSVRTDSEDFLRELERRQKLFDLKAFEKRLSLNYKAVDSHAIRNTKRSAQKAISKVQRKPRKPRKKPGSGVRNDSIDVSVLQPIDLFSQPYLSYDILRDVVKNNVSMIDRLDDEHTEALIDILTKCFARSISTKETVQKIQVLTNTTAKQAEFWAVDQHGSFFGDVSRIRQQAAGFPGYWWRTQKDAKVRDRHDQLGDQYIYWSSPPSVNAAAKGPIRRCHAGKDYRCRCYPEADFPPENSKLIYSDASTPAN